MPLTLSCKLCREHSRVRNANYKKEYYLGQGKIIAPGCFVISVRTTSTNQNPCISTEMVVSLPRSNNSAGEGIQNQILYILCNFTELMVYADCTSEVVVTLKRAAGNAFSDEILLSLKQWSEPPLCS